MIVFRRHEMFAAMISSRLRRRLSHKVLRLLVPVAVVWLGVGTLAAQVPVDGAIHGVEAVDR
jgi:hypothetical protein